MRRVVITKQCSTCHKRKPLREFHKTNGNILGVVSNCKICANKKARERYVYCYKKKGKLRRQGKDTHYGNVRRGFVAKKLWQYRSRLRVLKEHHIDVNFKGTELEQLANNERIDKILNKHGLGDIRHDSRASLQQSIETDAMPGMQEA